MASVQLAPVPAHIGIFTPFIAQGTETLIIKEKMMSLSGDSFDIKTLDGRPIFKVKGEGITSLSGRKHLYDMQGNHLFDLRKKKTPGLHTTFYGEDPKGNRFLEVASKLSFGSSKATGKFTSASGKAESLMMKGDWFDRSADITDEATGQAVARIDRKMLNAREFFGGQQTYALVVAPGVDMALMVAMCIALDEKENDK